MNISVNIVDCPSGVSESQKFAAADEVIKYLEDFDVDLLWDMVKDFHRLLEHDDARAVNCNTAWSRIQYKCDAIVWRVLNVREWHGFKNEYDGCFPRAEIWIYGNCC